MLGSGDVTLHPQVGVATQTEKGSAQAPALGRLHVSTAPSTSRAMKEEPSCKRKPKANP